jgi:hypothetical protein
MLGEGDLCMSTCPDFGIQWMFVYASPLPHFLPTVAFEFNLILYGTFYGNLRLQEKSG